MPSEKFFVHKEDGSLVRLKGRLVRFLDEEPPTGSDKSAIRTALEVSPDAEGLVQADIGTGPQNLVLHQHLGTMAYQDIAGVSAAKLEVESTTGTSTTQALTVTDGSSTNFVVQEDGSVGVGTSSPSSLLSIQASGTQESLISARANGGAGGGVVIQTDASDDGLLRMYDSAGAIQVQFDTDGGDNYIAKGNVGIGDTSPDHKLTIDSGDIQLQANKATNVPVQSINWKNTNSTGFDIARIQANTGANIYEGELRFITKDSGGTMATRWSISPSGNLVANGTAIDFGSAASGSGTPITNGGLLDDYEAGTFTPEVADATSGGNVGSAGTASGSYTKVGRVVHFSIVLGDIDTTGMTAGNTFYIRNLPFVSSTDPAAQLAAKTDNVTFNDSIVGSVVSGQSNAYLVSLRSANTDVNRQVSHITSGSADVNLTGTYIAA